MIFLQFSLDVMRLTQENRELEANISTARIEAQKAAAALASLKKQVDSLAKLHRALAS